MGILGFLKTVFLKTHDLKGFWHLVRTIQVAQKEHQVPQQQVEETPKQRTQEIGRFTQGSPKEHEPEFDFKAPRAQGGKGLLSHKISLQILQKSMA